MQKPRRSLPNFNNPEALLKQMICGKCGDIRLGHCDTCALITQINREHPELTSAGNWHLRSEQSKQASYLAKRKKALSIQIKKLEVKFNFLDGQKKYAPQNSKAIDKQISKLLDKQKMLNQKYEALLSESASATEQKQSEDQPKKDAREILIDQLQSLTAIAQQLVNDKQRYQSLR